MADGDNSGGMTKLERLLLLEAGRAVAELTGIITAYAAVAIQGADGERAQAIAPLMLRMNGITHKLSDLVESVEQARHE